VTANHGDQGSDPVAINVQELGVKYSLRFTRKTTVRQTLTGRMRRGDEETTFWALRDVTF
jgi:ABC-type polysaccharide/polyol phosphate transport system ATPase subunit